MCSCQRNRRRRRLPLTSLLRALPRRRAADGAAGEARLRREVVRAVVVDVEVAGAGGVVEIGDHGFAVPFVAASEAANGCATACGAGCVNIAVVSPRAWCFEAI